MDLLRRTVSGAAIVTAGLAFAASHGPKRYEWLFKYRVDEVMI